MRVAIWALPLALLLSQRSLWATVAATFVGWYATREYESPLPAPVWPGPFWSFRFMDDLPWVPSFAALLAVGCTQAGASGVLLGWPLAAAGLFAIASASAAWTANPFRLQDAPSATRPPFAPAAILTLIGLLHYVPFGGGGELTERGNTQEPTRTVTESGSIDGVYNGVILMPEVSPHPVLVPPLPFLRKSLFSKTSREPLSVPFFGVYWMFRWPLSRPPADAHVVRGNPLTSIFRSVDRNALQMEAHQNFGTLIDLSCCSKIQLAVRSTDGPVTISLILMNTTLPGKPALRLGEYSVDSTLQQNRADTRPLQVVIPFDVPRDPSIQEFDEATIVFRRPFAKASPKVAIDRFVFVPRSF